MKLNEIVTKRVSVREFNNKQVEKDDLLRILDCARLSPSAKNRQPWHYYVVNEKLKNDIANLMISWHESNPKNGTSVYPTALAIRQSAVLVLCFKKSESEFLRSDTLSIGSSIENMLLKATELGIGSLWICDTWYVKDEISKLLGVDLDLFSAIAFGYSDKVIAPRPRKPLGDIVTFID